MAHCHGALGPWENSPKLASAGPQAGRPQRATFLQMHLLSMQHNRIDRFDGMRRRRSIFWQLVQSSYRCGCPYFKITFQKHCRSLKITLHCNLSLSSIQKWTDAFISFRFVLIWLLHNTKLVFPSEILTRVLVSWFTYKQFCPAAPSKCDWRSD